MLAIKHLFATTSSMVFPMPLYNRIRHANPHVRSLSGPGLRKNGVPDLLVRMLSLNALVISRMRLCLHQPRVTSESLQLMTWKHIMLALRVSPNMWIWPKFLLQDSLIVGLSNKQGPQIPNPVAQVGVINAHVLISVTVPAASDVQCTAFASFVLCIWCSALRAALAGVILVLDNKLAENKVTAPGQLRQSVRWQLQKFFSGMPDPCQGLVLNGRNLCQRGRMPGVWPRPCPRCTRTLQGHAEWIDHLGHRLP